MFRYFLIDLGSCTYEKTSTYVSIDLLFFEVIYTLMSNENIDRSFTFFALGGHGDTSLFNARWSVVFCNLEFSFKIGV